MDPESSTAPQPAPLWLAHHHAADLDRCVRIGRHHVCRRCLVLYPVALAFAALIVAGVRSNPIELVAMWVLPLGVVIEWVGEHMAGWSHRPRRVAALSLVAGVGAGVALGRHLLHPFEMAATLPMVTFAVVCGVSALWGAASKASDLMESEWETDHDAAESARWSRLSTLVDDPG